VQTTEFHRDNSIHLTPKLSISILNFAVITPAANIPSLIPALLHLNNSLFFLGMY